MTQERINNVILDILQRTYDWYNRKDFSTKPDMAIFAKKIWYDGVKKCLGIMMEAVDYSDCLYTIHVLDLYIAFSLDRSRKDHIRDQWYWKTIQNVCIEIHEIETSYHESSINE